MNLEVHTYKIWMEFDIVCQVLLILIDSLFMKLFCTENIFRYSDHVTYYKADRNRIDIYKSWINIKITTKTLI